MEAIYFRPDSRRVADPELSGFVRFSPILPGSCRFLGQRVPVPVGGSLGGWRGSREEEVRVAFAAGFVCQRTGRVHGPQPRSAAKGWKPRRSLPAD
jgi:hypothetical protein